MCRFVAYHGPPILLEELLYEPEHSIIHQSTHAHERKEPLNGDGWGVGWYDRRISEQPGLYRTLHPAWSDDNMRHVSPLIETPLFLAHVRAASPGLPVQRLNCHPFPGGQQSDDRPAELDPAERGRRRLLFMHNGELGAYRQLIRKIQSELDDETFFSIQGSTDTEHVFAALQQVLGKRAADPTLKDLYKATVETLEFMLELKREIGEEDAVTQANFCLSDGERIVATRYVHPFDKEPQSLYVGTAESFYCEEGTFGARGPKQTGAALIASERLWDDDRIWQKVPQNHAVLVDANHRIEIQPLDVGA